MTKNDTQADRNTNDKVLLREARDVFSRCEEADKHNRETARDDVKFGRLGDQWPDEIAKQRQAEGRPFLTINRMPSFIL